MAGEHILSPFTYEDITDCEATKNFILDFAYRCNVKRVEPFTKMLLMALGMAVDSNRADVKESNQRAMEFLPSLKSHVLKTKVREYDIPQRTTRQYEITLGANVASVVPAGAPVSETWTLGTTIDTTATYNDAFFVKDYSVGFLYNTTDPVNIGEEMVLIVARDTVAGTIDVIRNHASADTLMPAWTSGTKIYLGENAIPEILPDCKVNCDSILAACCDKGYVQGFKSCVEFSKEWIHRPVYSPFADKEQEVYRTQMDLFIDRITNSLTGSLPSKFIDSTSNTPNYTMAGQRHWRQYYGQILVDDCCTATFDEAMLSIADDVVSPDFEDTNLYIVLASKQFMQRLRNMLRNENRQIFQPLADFKDIAPKAWEIARTMGSEQVQAYRSDGHTYIFIESPEYTAKYPFQADFINYGTLFFTTIDEVNEQFLGVNYQYGGFMRRIDPNDERYKQSSFCPLEVGYEGFIGMEQYCPGSNFTMKLVNCDPCTNEIILDANDNSGAVDLED